jgi:hypothetical protein
MYRIAHTLFAFFLLSTAVLADSLRDSRAEFQRGLDRTRSPYCVPESNVLQEGKIHFLSPRHKRELRGEDGYQTIEITVAKTYKPVHLFLQTRFETIWQLVVEDPRSLSSVTVFGPAHGIVTGIPESTAIHSLEFSGDGAKALPCELRTKPEKDLFVTLGVSSQGTNGHVHWLKRLDNNLKNYAETSLASIILPQSPTQGYVDDQAISRTAHLRHLGKGLLQHLKIPLTAPLGTEQAAVQVPDGLNGNTLRNWLLDNSFAEPATPELLEFLCTRDNASLFAAGWPSIVPGHTCTSREQWAAGRNIVLRRSLDIGKSYICDESDWLRLHVPRQLHVNGTFVNCSIHVLQN